MSTDTNENGSLATEAETKRIGELQVKLKTWAAEREIPFDAVAAAFGGDEPRGIEQQLPPFHTSVVWGDIFTPDGIKLHVVARAGATRSSVLGTVFAASNAFTQLIELGWMPADRRPRTEQEIAKTKAKLEEKLAVGKAKEPKAGAKRKAAKKVGATADTSDSDDQEAPSTRTIEVDTILKKVTDTGKLCYLVKGFPWRGWGATAWPDSSGIGKLGGVVEMSEWEVGVTFDFTEFDIQAVCTQKMGSKGKMIPIKVIDFVGDDALPDVPEDYDDGS